ncbi:TPA: MbeD family mobilization/exclusion protein [Escherichia coli]
MTELEGHLLNALEHLQQDYMRRLNEWESAFAELQKMHAVTQQNNAILNERVVNLSAYSALFDHGLASKSDQRFASIRSTGNLTFSTAF